ncbi:MAG: hypothetical protein V4692_06735 [Bdellovibrionota bacterium]
MKLTLIAGLIILAQSAFAGGRSFDGRWIGEGVTYSSADPAVPGKVYLEINVVRKSEIKSVVDNINKVMTADGTVIAEFVGSYTFTDDVTKPGVTKITWNVGGQDVDAGLQIATPLTYSEDISQQGINLHEDGYLLNAETLLRVGKFTMPDGSVLTYVATLKKQSK